MPSAKAEKSKADSLAIPLSQGLRSQDKELLDRCINTTNQRVIDMTVASLSPADAGILLQTAVDRLDMKIGQRQTLVTWIRAVLLRHTAYLMSSGGQQRSLARLQQVIDEQTQLIQPLTMLSGRLELLLAQAEIQEAASSPDVIMTDAKEAKDGPKDGASMEEEEEEEEEESSEEEEESEESEEEDEEEGEQDK